jgi:hypothetical protein
MLVSQLCLDKIPTNMPTKRRAVCKQQTNVDERLDAVNDWKNGKIIVSDG